MQKKICFTSSLGSPCSPNSYGECGGGDSNFAPKPLVLRFVGVCAPGRIVVPSWEASLKLPLVVVVASSDQSGLP